MKQDNCDQTCENTDGSFQCGCTNGWKLKTDNRTCIGRKKSIFF